MYDKRRSLRRATLSPCHIKAIFQGQSFTPLRIINHSRGGLLLELDTSLTPGEYVDIRFSSAAREATGYPLTSCVGFVRWCQRQDGRYGGRFGVGVELSGSLLLQRRM